MSIKWPGQRPKRYWVKTRQPCSFSLAAEGVGLLIFRNNKMKKDVFYFPHDSNAQNDPKVMTLIDELGPGGVGIYWMLLECLREQETYKLPFKHINLYARRWNADPTIIAKVIQDFELFEVEDGYFFSPSFLRRMQEMNEARAQKAMAGRKGGFAKAKKDNPQPVENQYQTEEKEPLPQQNVSTAIAPPQHRHSDAMAIKVNKSKVKESKKKEIKGGSSLPKTQNGQSPPPQTFFNNNFEKLKSRLQPEDLKDISKNFRYPIQQLTEFTDDWLKRKEYQIADNPNKYTPEALIRFYLDDLQKALIPLP